MSTEYDNIIEHPLFERQLELEQNMRSQGIKRFRDSLERAEKGGTYSETKAGTRLVVAAQGKMVEAIDAFIAEAQSGKAGKKHTALQFLKMLNDSEVAANLTARCVLDGLLKSPMMSNVAMILGSMIEDEVNSRRFQEEMPKAYAKFHEKAKKETLGRRKWSHLLFPARLLGIELEEWDGRIDNMTAEKKPDAEIVESLMADIPKNRDFLKIHPKEQQKMLLQLAAQQATKGNFGVAKTILSFERKDGPYKGSLMSDVELGEKATDLYAEIEKNQLKLRMKEQSVAAEQELYARTAAMAEQGAVLGVTDATIPDEKGEPKTIKAEQILKNTATKMLDNIQKEAAFRGIKDPAQIREVEKEKFVGAGLEHPVWFQAMNSAYTQASVNNVTQDKLPPTLTDAFTTYLDLYKDSPQYAGKFLNGKAMDFYETARVVLEGGIVNADKPEDALRITQLVTRDPAENDSLTKQKYEDIDAAVSKAVSNSSGLLPGWLGGATAAGNTNYIKSSIVKTAQIYARAGLSNEEALAKARETFEKSNVNVAGTYIKADKNMPPDFAPLAEQYITEFAAKHNLDPADLTISSASNGSGGYFVAERSTYLPAVIGAPDLDITPDTINQLRQRNRDQKVKEVVDAAKK